MIEKFKNIDIHNEKVEKIINAAFEEFGKYGEDKASLNNILKSSGISKGVFYHYFQNKDDLHEFLHFFSAKTHYEVLDNEEIWNEPDILNRIIKSVRIKCGFMKKYPYFFEFFDAKTPKQIKQFMDEYDMHELNINKTFYHDHLDFSLLKQNIDIEKLVNLAHYTMKQIEKEYLDYAKQNGVEVDINAMIKKMEEYNSFIRMGYYK